MEEEEAEEYYKKRYEEVLARLSDPKVEKDVEKYLKKISRLVDCDVSINYLVFPHMDEYAEIQDSENYIIPEQTTMKLNEVIEHLEKEKDGNMGVYIDPIYLKSGVNEIVDILITTSDERMIIVPIANNKK